MPNHPFPATDSNSLIPNTNSQQPIGNHQITTNNSQPKIHNHQVQSPNSHNPNPQIHQLAITKSKPSISIQQFTTIYSNPPHHNHQLQSNSQPPIVNHHCPKTNSLPLLRTTNSQTKNPQPPIIKDQLSIIDCSPSIHNHQYPTTIF